MNDSKLYTESLIYDRLEKSLVSHKMSKNNDMCLEILKTFRKGIIETLELKVVKKKKILKLVEWMIEGITTMLSKGKVNTEGDFHLDTEEIKITL